jgi:hypothetical protein
MKSSINQIKNSIESLIHRLNQLEDKVDELSHWNSNKVKKLFYFIYENL